MKLLSYIQRGVYYLHHAWSGNRLSLVVRTRSNRNKLLVVVLSCSLSPTEAFTIIKCLNNVINYSCYNEVVRVEGMKNLWDRAQIGCQWVRRCVAQIWHDLHVLSRTDKSTTPFNHLDTRVVRLPISARIGRRSGLAKRSRDSAARNAINWIKTR